MSSSESERKTTTRGFRDAWLLDRRRGTRRGLTEYLDLFPGDEVALAEEFVQLEKALGGSDGAAADLPADLPGRIGPYLLVEEIGRGAQGRVYLARDTRLGRRAAVKVLELAGADVADSLLRFQREARIASALDHRGFCPIYDTGCDDGHAWIAMGFVAGRTLAERIRHARLADARELENDWWALGDGGSEAPRTRPFHAGPATREDVVFTLRFFERTARALHAAHEAGVVHRDVKPGNLMVAADGHPVILDFGLARSVEDALQGLTETGSFHGTPAYAAPELLGGGADRADHRCDVWSLGASLYEALTWQRPFRAPTREALVATIRGEEPVRPSALNPALAPEIDRVVLRALAKKPARRFADARELATALRRARCQGAGGRRA